MTIVAPLNKLAAPEPVTALPIMSAVELGATAETMEPSSKTATEMQYVHLRLYRV
jgi:hypothetical protein